MKSHSAKFWAVADYFRKAGQPWFPSTAGYETWRTVEADGTRWSVCVKVHAVPARKGPEAPVQFKASITLWGEGETRGGRKRTAKGWPVAVRRHLERAGYTGDWMQSPHGVFGDFWKDLPTPAAVRREAKRLLSLELPAASAGPGKAGRLRQTERPVRAR